MGRIRFQSHEGQPFSRQFEELSGKKTKKREGRVDLGGRISHCTGGRASAGGIKVLDGEGDRSVRTDKRKFLMRRNWKAGKRESKRQCGWGRGKKGEGGGKKRRSGGEGHGTIPGGGTAKYGRSEGDERGEKEAENSGGVRVRRPGGSSAIGLQRVDLEGN